MTPHPSLIAPRIALPRLKPVEKMGRNEPCWCRSGKKFKTCHYRRDEQKPINIYEAERLMLDELDAGYCSHPDPTNDPCKGPIAKAHTIQRRGGLTAVAEEGHVLTVRPSMKVLEQTNGNPEPRKIGVGKASVFKGFCGRHDTSIFKPIEGKTLSLSKETAFLFAYRVIAYERYAKEAQFRGIRAQRDADRGRPFSDQVAVQMHVATFLAGVEIGRMDLERWGRHFDEMLLSGDLTAFHFVAVAFDQVLPVVACGGFHPEFDLAGKSLQHLGRQGDDFEHVTLTVTAFESQTVVVFGWIGTNDGTAKALADSFLAVPDDRKADALVRLLFIHTDNVYFRPSWWENLPDSGRKAINLMIKSGTTMRERSGAEIADSSVAFVTASVLSSVAE